MNDDVMAQDTPTQGMGIGAIFAGIGNAYKNQYNIQMARQVMGIKQQELDNDTKYKNAQVDYLEGRGQLAGQQADAYRFLIKKATDVGQTKIDSANDDIDAAHMQVQQQGSTYRGLLNQALQTPEGQNYIANATGGTTEATGMPQGEGMPSTPSPAAISDAGSSVVNNIMPGVGANQANVRQNTTIPTTSYGLGRQLNASAGLGPQAAEKRNTSLQKAMGNIDAMGIDNREDAQYAMEKYYGADWNQNPEAVQFMNSKFGPEQQQQQTPSTGFVQTSEGVTVPANGAGAQQQQQQQNNGQQNANDMVPVTGPDGNNYKVPRANLQKALQRGYRVRQ